MNPSERNKKKAWLREPTVTKVTGPMRPVTGNRKVARFPGNDLPFVCKVGLFFDKES